MAYIIADPCVGTCDTACVEVCPVDCIHGPEDKEGAGSEAKEDGFDPTDKQLYIDPEECIDCGACVPECPYEAIFEEDEVPSDYTAKGGEYIARLGLEGHYEGENEQGEQVTLDCTRQLDAGEVLDLTEDIQPNYDYFTDGPGYDALDM